MKKLFGSMFIFCLTLALILGTFTFCFAEITRTGSFAFEVGKDSIGVENVNIDLDLYLKANGIGTQIDFELSKEQTNDELTELNILMSLQGDYFFTPEWYGFGGASYERDKQWSIDDYITFGAGAGYKVKNLNLQAGLYWASEYSGMEYDRQSLLKLAGDYTKPLYAITGTSSIDFVLEAEAVVDLEGIEALDDWEDYKLNIKPMAKAYITKTVFFGLYYDWAYLDNAEEPTQWEWGGRFGWNFI